MMTRILRLSLIFTPLFLCVATTLIGRYQAAHYDQADVATADVWLFTTSILSVIASAVLRRWLILLSFALPLVFTLGFLPFPLIKDLTEAYFHSVYLERLASNDAQIQACKIHAIPISVRGYLNVCQSRSRGDDTIAIIYDSTDDIIQPSGYFRSDWLTAALALSDIVPFTTAGFSARRMDGHLYLVVFDFIHDPIRFTEMPSNECANPDV